MTYKFAAQAEGDFIKEIAAIDAQVFPKEMQGTEKSIRARYNANKESYILAYQNRRIVGYICFFPVSKSFAEKMRTQDKAFDDDISPKDILPSYEGSEGVDVFAISSVVLPEFQRMGTGTELVRRLFSLFSDKIQSGCLIKSISSYAYTDAGAALLERGGFGLEKCIKNQKTKSVVRQMVYTFDDFQKANIYLFVPFYIDDAGQKIHALDNYKAQTDASGYIAQLEKVSKNEFAKGFSEKLERCYLGRERFVVMDDENEKVICDDKEFELYFTYYNDFYIATLIFEGFGMDPTILLSQASLNSLRVFKSGGQGGSTGQEFNEYIAERLKLDPDEFRQAGQIRSLTSLIAKPTEKHLAFMMACECYTKSYLTTHLTSPQFFEKARKNCAQYDFSEIYVSEKNVVYVLKSEDDRLGYESLMIFIMELLSLQVSAISSTYDEIMIALDKMEFSQSIIESVNVRFSRAAMLWNINNFVFLGAKKIFDIVSEEFGIPSLKEEYNENLNIFEKLTVMKTQKDTARYSKNTQRHVMFFSILSWISTLGAIIALIFEATTDKTPKALTTLILGFVSVSTFILSVSLARRGMKNNKPKKKNRRAGKE